MINTFIDIETTNLLHGKGLDAPFDERTGFLKDDREILEVGYLRADDETKEFLSAGTLYFYKPYFKVESCAQEATGLTREFLEKYEDQFDENLIKLVALIQQTNICGKNSDIFDIPFIKGFIEKHSKYSLCFERMIYQDKIKRIDGNGYLEYSPWLYSTDIQKIFSKKWKEMYERKYNISVGRRLGTLMEYVEILELQNKLEELYAKIPKDRVTKAHGALYDTVATYLVWCECIDMGLFD